MKHQVFFNGTVWNTDEVIYNSDGSITFESRGKDGKYLIKLRQYDLITELLSNIAVPLEVVKP